MLRSDTPISLRLAAIREVLRKLRIMRIEKFIYFNPLTPNHDVSA